MLLRYRSEYQRAGLKGLHALMDADEGEGRHERLLVRVAGPQAELEHSTHPPSWGAFDLSRLDDPAAQASGWMSIESPDDGSVLEVGTARLAGGVLVQVGRSSRVRDELLGNFRAHAIEVAIALVLLALGGGIAIAYGALAPVRDMQATAGTILQTKRYTARVPTRGTRDPLDQLGARINDMLGQIETLVGGMKGALDNVAHDLRTPLTRLRASLEELKVHAPLDEVSRGAVETALAEADGLLTTFAALLRIARIESGSVAASFVELRLDEVVRDACDLYRAVAEERGVALVLSEHPVVVQGDRDLLFQALANVLDNAVKYTPDDGRIVVSVAPEGAWARIVVSDSGRGVPADEREKVVQRFYRLERDREAAGSGLGLSLVQAVVSLHHGTLELDDNAPGLRVTLNLPTAPVRAG